MMFYLQIVSYGFIWILAQNSHKPQKENIPISFSEYGIVIYQIKTLGDTLYHNRSSKEKFKLVFLDYKGGCYCERYLGGNLIEKGFYENSLDTLKHYIYSRIPEGGIASIRVEKYFQPIRTGDWFFYHNGKEFKHEKYQHGVLTE